MNRGFVFDSFTWIILIRYTCIRALTESHLFFLKPKQRNYFAFLFASEYTLSKVLAHIE